VYKDKDITKPIVLSPQFSKSNLKYSAILESKADKVIIKAICSELDSFSHVLKLASDGAVSLIKGNNTVQIKVESADGSTTVYEIDLYIPLNSDASLQSITLPKGFHLVPDFSRTETEYIIPITQSTEQIKVEVKALNSNSTIKGPNGFILNPGDTDFTFIVTSENIKESSI
jgi:hypothetical protein